jgi:hypothetical protein
MIFKGVSQKVVVSNAFNSYPGWACFCTDTESDLKK